jgi:hypothetical protein
MRGTADFIASLVLPEPNMRQYADRWQYGCAHETKLASRYIQEQSVYAQAKDKIAALRRMLRVTDARARSITAL